MDNSKSTGVVFSYVPLFWGDPTQTADATALEGILKEIDSIDAGRCRGAAWSMSDGVAEVTFIIDKATEIASHLNSWAEMKPEEWFSLHYLRNDHGYAMVIFPDLKKSVERMRTNNPVMDQPDMSYRIIFKPLNFSSVNTAAFEQASPFIKEKMKVFLLDSDLVNPEKFSNNHLNHRVYLGEFKIFDNDQVTQMLESAIEAERDSLH